MNSTEKRAIGQMIYIYCRAKHGTSQALCSGCHELNVYAQKRLSRCPFGDQKPTCQKCTIHCYNNEMRNRIRKVMKYAGPRMLLRNPALVIRHLIKSI